MLRAALFRIVKTWKQLRCPSCFPGGSDGIESACNVENLGSVLGSGRSPGEGNGYPLQYSCLENTHGQRSLVDYSHGFTKSQTRLSNKHTHTRCPSKHVCVCVCVCVCVYVSLFSPVQLFATSCTVAC